MDVLGISAFSGPASAALVRDGRVLAAAREEHFTRRAGDRGFPRNAVAYCLRAGKIGPSSLHAVAWSGRPRLAFENHLASALAHGPADYSFFRRTLIEGSDPVIESREWIARELDAALPLHEVESAFAQAAGAFFASPFASAAVLTLVRGEDGAATMLASGNGTELAATGELPPASSLVAVLDAFREIAGAAELDAALLHENGEPGANAREAACAREIGESLLAAKSDGSFAPRPGLFLPAPGAAMPAPALRAWARSTQLEGAALARAVVAAVGDLAGVLARQASVRAGESALVFAGPLAAHPALRARVRAANPGAAIWTHPAAWGGIESAGAAWLASARDGAAPARVKEESAPRSSWAIGPGYNSHPIRTFLRSRELAPAELEDDALAARVAALLAEGGRVGWFQGRLDLGEAPFGSRAVLARTPAPAIDRLVKLAEDERAAAPEFAHAPEPADPGVLRVSRTEHRALHGVLAAYASLPGNPPASLAARPLALDGGPVACTPGDAFDCFLALDLDAIALGPYLVTRAMHERRERASAAPPSFAPEPHGAPA